MLSDIADLTVMDSGVSIYDSKATDGSVINDESYGEYAGVFPNGLLPDGLRCGVDYIYRSNEKNWKIVKGYVKDIFESVLTSVRWYEFVKSEDADEAKSLFEQMFECDKYPTIDTDGKTYVFVSPFLYSNLIDEYGYEDFSGKELDFNRMLANISETEIRESYLCAVNNICIAIGLNFEHIQYSREGYKGTVDDKKAFSAELAAYIELIVFLPRNIIAPLDAAYATC
jgi:hypothetical protein